MNEQAPSDRARAWSREEHRELAALITDHRDKLRRYLRRFAPGVDHDNVIGEALLALLRQWPYIHGDKVAWLTVVARRRAIDQMRADQRQPELLPADEIDAFTGSALDTPGAPRVVALLVDIIQHFPKHISHCLLMHYGGKSASEIAEVQQCSVPTAQQYISRGQKRLREALRQLEEIPPSNQGQSDQKNTDERNS